MIIQADAREVPLPNESVHAVVTSPPYWGLRTYGENEDMEMGRHSIRRYLADLGDWAEEMWRVLVKGGALWINIGDTAVGSGGAGGDWNKASEERQQFKFKQGPAVLPGGKKLKNGQWAGIPHRLAFMLQEQGWLLRWDGVWEKPNPRPEDLAHCKRPGVSHESLFLFSKGKLRRFHDATLTERGSVWRVVPGRSMQGTTAAFNRILPMRCIRATTREGEVVLDPFVGGSATTVSAAAELGRVGIGVDLYKW